MSEAVKIGETIGRRLKSFAISGELIGSIAKGGVWWIKVVSEIPKDAEFIAAHFDPSRHVFIVTMEHATFDEVPAGCKIPIAAEPVLATVRED